MSPTTAHHLGRNDPCHCGSGKKYKHCCLEKDEAAERAAAAVAAPAEGTKAEGTGSEEATAAPARPPRPPKHQTQQPWKKSAANTHGFHRMTSPRKVGGS